KLRLSSRKRTSLRPLGMTGRYSRANSSTSFHSFVPEDTLSRHPHGSKKTSSLLPALCVHYLSVSDLTWRWGFAEAAGVLVSSIRDNRTGTPQTLPSRD